MREPNCTCKNAYPEIVHFKGCPSITVVSNPNQKVEEPVYRGKGEHNILQLERICEQYKEYCHYLTSEALSQARQEGREEAAKEKEINEDKINGFYDGIRQERQRISSLLEKIEPTILPNGNEMIDKNYILKKLGE